MAYKRRNLSKQYFRRLVDKINLDDNTSMYFKERFTESSAIVSLFTGDDELMFQVTAESNSKQQFDKESNLDECYREMSIVFTERGIRHTLKDRLK